MKYTITDKPKKYSRQYNVYKIVNEIDDKIYIGSTTTPLWHRMSQHRADAKKGEKSKLYDLMRLYGIDKFKIELICVCSEENIRIIEEQEISKIDNDLLLNSYKSCINSHSNKFDYNYIVDVYNKTKSFNKTAKIVGCSRPTVKKAVEMSN